jgi:hypothetical protein
MERRVTRASVVVPFVLVLAAAAVLLRAADWLPTALGAEPRGIRRHETVRDVELKTGQRVWLPVVFPDTLAWPAARIRLVLGEPAVVGLTFADRATRAGDLIVCETLGERGRIPPSLVPDGLVLQTLAVTIAGRPAALTRLSLDDGRIVHDVSWESSDRSIRLRFDGPVDQLLRMAESLERNRR